jgi:DNA-binding NarL/FixJ family response regulator
MGKVGSSGDEPFEADGVRLFSLEHADEMFLVVSAPIEAPPYAALSPAELEIARALARGANNAKIARKRGTSQRTVANQVGSLMRRLGVQSRTQVATKMALADTLGGKGPQGEERSP